MIAYKISGNSCEKNIIVVGMPYLIFMIKTSLNFPITKQV